MRGAHSDVWCSKGTPLMEAELFAAERGRPAPSGRALVCAANHASEIQGITASQNLPDARNRAPVTPVSLHIFDVSAQRKVRGVKRGQETILGVLSPFVPAGEHRLSPPPDGGNFPPAVGTAFSPPPDGGGSAAFGGNSYDGRQFPSLTQVVSLSRTIVTIYPFLPKLSATIRPSAVWKI